MSVEERIMTVIHAILKMPVIETDDILSIMKELEGINNDYEEGVNSNLDVFVNNAMDVIVYTVNKRKTEVS